MKRIGIVGAGRIGPEIALHLAGSLVEDGGSVVVCDVSQDALDSALARLEKRLRENPSGAGILASIDWSTDLSSLSGVDMVVEAVTEDLPLKQKLFRDIEGFVRVDTVLASNSSHYEPGEVARLLEHPERSLVTHFFFPAYRNRLVEVVPSSATIPDAIDSVSGMLSGTGKEPVLVRSRVGFAINPVFEGLVQGAVLCLEEGLGSVREIDAVACRALGLGVGPFTAMNLTGGNGLVVKGLELFGDRISGWFKPPRALLGMVESGLNWDVAARGETVDLSDRQFELVGGRLLATWCGLACEVLDSLIIGIDRLNMAIGLGLAAKPPFELMNDRGLPDVLVMVEDLALRQPGFPVAGILKDTVSAGDNWSLTL